jgi:hypothetical protein
VQYYLNVLFPDGSGYSNRVDENLRAIQSLETEYKAGKPARKMVEDSPFRRGEVRCLLPQYQLARHAKGQGGPFTVVVSAGKPVQSVNDPAVISNAIEETWPMHRPIVHRAPRSRRSAPAPVDEFVPPPPQPRVEPVPPPKQEKS